MARLIVPQLKELQKQLLNPFQPNVSFQYTLETSEKVYFFVFFRGKEMEYWFEMG